VADSRSPSRIATIILAITVAIAITGAVPAGQPQAADAMRSRADIAAQVPFDHRLLRLMNDQFCQETPLFDVAIYDALPDAWGDADRRALPAGNPARRLAIGRRYGLTPPPPGVQEFPLGLVPGTESGRPVVRANCLTCHSTELFGHPVVGLGNNRLDFEALMDDVVTVSKASNTALGPFAAFYAISKRHGIGFGTTVGSTAPLTFAALFMAVRHPDLVRRQTPDALLERVEGALAGPLARRLGAEQFVRALVMFGMQDIDQDAPSWWLTRADGRIFCDSLVTKEGRATMLFVAEPWAEAGAIAGRLSAAEEFVAHLGEVQLPASYAEMFPERVDPESAAAGRTLFTQHCAECHGTYGEDSVADVYPGRVIPVGEIGTDPRRARGITPQFREFLAGSWFASPGSVRGGDEPEGYRAPYLRRVAFTFPYFHNGSVPTLHHVLFPDERPARWIVAPQDFDHVRIGQHVDEVPVTENSPADRRDRDVFDTSLPGKANAGHERMLDPLSPEDRAAILEYLKTL
jgi:mono/diheme cytochrome c family protein